MDIPWDLADETDLAIPDAPPLPSDGSRRDSARVVNHTATATSPIVIQFLSWSSDTTLKYV